MSYTTLTYFSAAPNVHAIPQYLFLLSLEPQSHIVAPSVLLYTFTSVSLASTNLSHSFMLWLIRQTKFKKKKKKRIWVAMPKKKKAMNAKSKAIKWQGCRWICDQAQVGMKHRWDKWWWSRVRQRNANNNNNALKKTNKTETWAHTHT